MINIVIDYIYIYLNINLKFVMNVDFKNISSGEIIYKYNEKPENLYLIHSGKIKLLSKNGMEIAILESGEIFGLEILFLDILQLIN